MNTEQDMQERFWDKVDRSSGADGCWAWTGAVWQGRGRVSHHGTVTNATRVSLEFSLDRPIREGYFVRSTCHTLLCVNPQHLKEVDPSREHNGQWWCPDCSAYLDKSKFYFWRGSISTYCRSHVNYRRKVKETGDSNLPFSPTVALSERTFDYYVDKSDPNGCWNWQGGISNGNAIYKNTYAPRVAFERANGEMPDRVFHTCSNRICVNPAHLIPQSRRYNRETDTWVCRGCDEALPRSAYLSGKKYPDKYCKLCLKSKRDDS